VGPGVHGDCTLSCQGLTKVLGISPRGVQVGTPNITRSISLSCTWQHCTSWRAPVGAGPPWPSPEQAQPRSCSAPCPGLCFGHLDPLGPPLPSSQTTSTQRKLHQARWRSGRCGGLWQTLATPSCAGSCPLLPPALRSLC